MQYSTNNIESILSSLANHKFIPQKSEEWLAARKNLIAASEAGYLLGIKSTSSMINYIKAKCNLSTSLDNLGKLNSIRHGNIYEDVARAIYQSRHHLVVAEYGLITTTKHTFLGASPDGIVIRENHTTSPTKQFNSIAESRIGRLVEIKNPYDYDASDMIKPEYAVQILQQQFVLDLPKCDFIKTNIIGAIVNDKTSNKGFKPYSDIDEFLADRISEIQVSTIEVANKNIPIENLTSKGMEKGIIIHYKEPNSGQYITHIYSLETPYTKTDILEWIKTTKKNISSETGLSKSVIAVEYWYLAAYYEKTLEYDSQLFENIYLPRLELVWKLIIQIRQMQEIHSSEVILQFIDTILKTHIKRSSTFYKSSDNQKEICNLLESTLQLEMPVEIKIDKSEEQSKINCNKESKKNKAKKHSRNKILIEYDF